MRGKRTQEVCTHAKRDFCCTWKGFKLTFSKLKVQPSWLFFFYFLIFFGLLTIWATIFLTGIFSCLALKGRDVKHNSGTMHIQKVPASDLPVLVVLTVLTPPWKPCIYNSWILIWMFHYQNKQVLVNMCSLFVFFVFFLNLAKNMEKKKSTKTKRFLGTRYNTSVDLNCFLYLWKFNMFFCLLYFDIAAGPAFYL